MADQQAQSTPTPATAPRPGGTATSATAIANPQPVTQATAGGTGEGGGAKPDLDALLKQHPDLNDVIQQRFVSPAVRDAAAKTRDQVRQEVEREMRSQVQQEDMDRRLGELETKAQAGDAAALAEIGRIALQTRSQTKRSQQEMTARQQLERDVTVQVMTGIFGVDANAIPADARKDFDSLKSYLAEQSPYVQGVVKAAVDRAKSDQTAVQAAGGAAAFAERLAATPNPSGGDMSGPAPTGQVPLSPQEWSQNKGNTAWRQANQARIKQAFYGADRARVFGAAA